LSMEAGSVVPIETDGEVSVELHLENRAVTKGKALRSGDNYAVEVCQPANFQRVLGILAEMGRKADPSAKGDAKEDVT